MGIVISGYGIILLKYHEHHGLAHAIIFFSTEADDRLVMIAPDLRSGNHLDITREQDHCP